MGNYWVLVWVLAVLITRSLAMLAACDELLGARHTGRPTWGLYVSIGLDLVLACGGLAVFVRLL